jgi:hypothetical protein
MHSNVLIWTYQKIYCMNYMLDMLNFKPSFTDYYYKPFSNDFCCRFKLMYQNVFFNFLAENICGISEVHSAK